MDEVDEFFEDYTFQIDSSKFKENSKLSRKNRKKKKGAAEKGTVLLLEHSNTEVSNEAT